MTVAKIVKLEDVIDLNEINTDDKSYDEVIKELSDRWNTDKLLSFNETNIKDKLAENASQIWHFTELYQKEKNEYDKIMEMKEIVEGHLFNYYKANYNTTLKTSEIEKYYIPKDPNIIRINKIAKRQQWVCDFYDALRKSLEKMQWNMQNFMKSMTYGL